MQPRRRAGRPGPLGQLPYVIAALLFIMFYVWWIRSSVAAVSMRLEPGPSTGIPVPRRPSTERPLHQSALLVQTEPPRPAPTTTTAHPKTPPRTTPDCRSVDLSSRDPNARDNPGGTEEEALQYRRVLTDALWPIPPLDRLPWRTATPHVRKDAPLACAQQEVPANTFAWQWHGRAAREHACAATDFGCRLNAYRNIVPHGNVANRMCDGVYGRQLIDRFRASNVNICSSAGAQVGCKMVTVHGTHDVETSICRAQRAVVAFEYIEHGDYPWLAFKKGALDVACKDTVDGSRIRGAPQAHFMHCLADWMTLGYRSAESADGNPGPSCEAFDDTPTIFVTRSGDYSPFALTHDWINLVVLMASESLMAEDVQIIIMDRMTAGFYSPVWQVAFSPGHPVAWYPDIHDDRHRLHRRRVCYRDAYFNIPARLSPIYNEDECGAEVAGAYRSPLYHVYRDHILHSFRAIHTVGGLPSRPLWATVVVTLIMRRNYATGHSIGRRIGNAESLTAALRRELSVDSADVRFLVNQVDFAEHDFDVQLNISRATDVLVAMHGAGLAQMMFMHPWGGVFEFFCPEKPSSNYRYRQLANKMGIRYDAYSIANDQNEVPIAEVMPQLLRLGHAVAADKQRFLDAPRDK